MKKWISTTVLGATLLLAPVQAFANLGDQTLRPTMTASEVKTLQSMLKDKGYFTYSGSYTSYYGSYTKSAVIGFQRAKGLSADGVAGRSTFDKLGVYKVNNSYLVDYAKRYLGTPYKWGGTDPSGFDCSGYVDYVFKQSHSITLPRTAKDMWANIGYKVTTLGVGDLVFFSTTDSGASHVGIYIGSGKFISATSSNGVSIAEMSNTYWQPRYLGAKRL
ncbi:C40 family peptidase [Fictibacillus barbaricus]|uniref:Cell wall-associated NlpC family hydrolase n=1 Tax=Fictibacillus barbaricus TaxID=182136 RepID=A0ABU1U1V1_9BACL|nr:NlpC/P60 family protein [Fictibacillus barbaricus]MDR7073393.1 cell wall-associated NlpC family hydrolase [Fictibacillus barbaricus]